MKRKTLPPQKGARVAENHKATLDLDGEDLAILESL